MSVHYPGFSDCWSWQTLDMAGKTLKYPEANAGPWAASDCVLNVIVLRIIYSKTQPEMQHSQIFYSVILLVLSYNQLEFQNDSESWWRVSVKTSHDEQFWVYGLYAYFEFVVYAWSPPTMTSINGHLNGMPAFRESTGSLFELSWFCFNNRIVL